MDDPILGLEGFVDRLIELGASKGYVPTGFMRMRQAYGTCQAIERLMVAGEVQSGFVKLRALGLLAHSLEAAVLEFPALFRPDIQKAAQWRLEQAARLAAQKKGSGHHWRRSL